MTISGLCLSLFTTVFFREHCLILSSLHEQKYVVGQEYSAKSLSGPQLLKANNSLLINNGKE